MVFTSPDRNRGFASSPSLPWLVFQISIVLLAAFAPAAGQSILGGCLYSLDPSANQAFFITGSTSISAGCSVVVESNSSSAFKIGGTETLNLGNHAKVGVVGGSQIHAGSIVDTMSNQQVQPVAIASPGDPLASVAAPTQGTIISPTPVNYDMNHPPANDTLSPGVYCGGVTFGNPNGATFTMAPGTYIMAGGGFRLGSQANVSGSGVTIYNTSSAGWGCSGTYPYSPIDMEGQAKANLSAPTRGSLAGILFFGDRNGCTSPGKCTDQINGGAAANFTGNLYFPGDQLLISGTGSIGGCMGVVADTISVNGNSGLNIQGCTVVPITVAVAPQAPIAIYANQQQQFAAAVTNTYNTAVTWSISPANLGSIDASGVYTAPSSISTQQTVTISATSQSNPNISGSTTITLFPPVTVAVAPTAALLYQGQTQQFTAAVGNAFNTTVSWSVSPAGAGSVDGTGLYTAPAAITTQQVVTVTATSVVDPTKSASASITLMPPIQVSVAPASAKLYASQQQQFSTTVINTSNTAVNWTISPAGVGSVDSTGLYTAPASINSQQTVTLTATSEADPTKSASAMVNLLPLCTWNGYSYGRAIVIDHTKVQGTDQKDFPVLISLTDPLLASSANGGHVQNANGYDIVFSADPAGQSPLDFEIDHYDPVTGSAAFWVRIPTLSHSADTTLYMWYGNSAISAGQENKPGVWRNGYGGVWHFGPTGALSAADSTSNANNGVNHNVTSATGLIGGAGHFDGSGSTYFDIPSSNSYKPTSAITVEAWVNMAGPTNWPDIFSLDYRGNGSWYSPYQAYALQFQSNTLQPRLDVATAGNPTPLYGTNSIVPGEWTHIAGIYDGNNLIVYANGVPISVLQHSGAIDYGTSQDLDIGTRSPYTSAEALNGLIDEARISNVARSPGWIATEVNNQSSPNTFYSIYPENFRGVVPSTASLFVQSSEQFSVAGNCSAPTISWSISPSGVGSVTTSGLYTAPAAVSDPQSATLVATDSTSGTQLGTVSLTILPHATVAVSPVTATIYRSGASQQFTATVSNAQNTAVTWSISPAGVGTIDSTGLYTAPGFSTPEVVTVTATSVADPSASASATLNLTPVVITPWMNWMYEGMSQQFTSSVPVNWSISPAGAGSITQTGLYTAPVDVSSWPNVTITATSQADPLASSSLHIGISGIWYINPSTETLPPGQAVQFETCEPYGPQSNSCSSSFPIWSVSSAGDGTVNSSGYYTAPAWVATAHAVTVTATDPVNPAVTLSATVNLLPNVISVSPATATLYGGQSVQLSAAITRTADESVTWTLSPGSAGTLSSSGLYTAPLSIPSAQTVTITATSQGDPALAASATITLSPTQCASLAYGYMRTITIDHRKVPNTDQVDFPLLVSATDPELRSVSNGGHVASASGDDLLFSSDPAGQNRLDYELEQYNPQTGQIIAWVRVPKLLHATDTVLYMFYGNSAITSPQSNPGGVWHNGFQSVYHLSSVANNSPADSAGSGNGDPALGLASTSGAFDTATAFDGSTSYLQLPQTVYSAYPTSGQTSQFPGSFAVWFKTTSQGVILGQNQWQVAPGAFYLGGAIPALYVDSNGLLRGDFFNLKNQQITYYPITGANYSYTSAPQIVSPNRVNDGQWHFVALTYSSGTQTLYLDGTALGSEQNVFEAAYSGLYQYFVGTGFEAGWPATSAHWGYFNGSLEEVEVSGSTRSADWLKTEYFNQSSPSTFATLSAEIAGTAAVVPSATSLRASESQQFAVVDRNVCGQGAADWSMAAGSPGTLSPGGLYTAPPTVDTEQTVSLTGVTLGANSQTLTATVTLVPPVSLSVTPPSAVLTAGQSMQLQASVANASSTAVAWTVSPEGVGNISSSGIYTAPSTLATQQSVVVTATSLEDTTKSASATLTLIPPAAVTAPLQIVPGSVNLYAGQTEQFIAATSGGGTPAVVWSVQAGGAGTITAAGLYAAPVSVAAQQTVTIIATSQSDSTVVAQATVNLLPVPCVSAGYSSQRVIIIDHTKVANSDQVDFPFLFDTTDRDLASTANGGHVINPAGDDIIFSLDPNGQTKLDHEVESYDPATGHLTAWVRIPVLSHTADTIVYLLYGNPNISTSQQNPSGVWNSKYQAVYHLANAGNAPITDSTSFQNNATPTALTSAPGVIDSGGNLDGSTSYLQIPSADFPSFPTGVYDNLGLPSSATSSSFAASVGMWFKTATSGGLLTQVPQESCTDYFAGCISYGPTTPGYYDPQGWGGWMYVDDAGALVAGNVTTQQTYTDNQWHYAVWTEATDGTEVLYVDGKLAGTTTGNFPVGYSPEYSYFVGTAYTLLGNNGNWNWLYFKGSIDEVTIANQPFSADWVQTEYNNQSSPSTFYSLAQAGALQLVPLAASLYAGQTQQFAVSGACTGSVSWALASGAGTLSPSGLFAAPSSIASAQSATVTATNVSSGTAIGTATVSLLPTPAPLSLAAESQPPYSVGTAEAFRATLLDANGNGIPGIAVTFTITGVNGTVGSATSDQSGVAEFSYTGSNPGTDAIQASANLNGQLVTSGSVSAVWLTPPPPVQAAGVTLAGPPLLGAGGLLGAFTDGTGAVIEPVAIGAAPMELIVPAGATQFQLGVNSEYYANNGGTGFIVVVNGNRLTVPPTAMPWTYSAGALNSAYQYGVYAPSVQNGILDGSAPVVAATGLTAGQTLNIAYQSGTVSIDPQSIPLAKADGDPAWPTGIVGIKGTHFPTLYITSTAYPLNQPVSFSASVKDANGQPVAGVPVTLNVSGANPQSLQATSDAAGIATFLYTGKYSGTDTLQAQAAPSSGGTLASALATINWVSYPAPQSLGSIALSYFAVVNDFQEYVSLTKDSGGNPQVNADIEFRTWGADTVTQDTTTDSTGHSGFGFMHSTGGAYSVVAIATVDRNVVVSNVMTGTWTPPNGTSTCDNCDQINVSISAQSTVILPNALQLDGTVSDTSGVTPAVQWSQVSGPGPVTFANSQQAVTTASFTIPGTYVLQLYATDTSASASAQFTVTVKSKSMVIGGTTGQGWIGSPLYGSAVSGLVPITLAPGVSLQSGTLIYAPAGNTNAVTVLNSNVSGSGQIGTLDTTTLQNGAYWIQMTATDTSGNSQYSLILVQVSGNYKPGRVTTTVTDLVVPSTGLPINIQRTYDSLNAGVSSDFGFGWSLGINVNLAVDPANNVTFTLGGQRKTFYFTPQAAPCSPLIGCPFGFVFSPTYTPEPGLHGTLVSSGPGCPGGFDLLNPDGSCQTGGPYVPPGYIYTDPNGTAYTIAASGALQSIADRNGNGLTITPNGITSTSGLSVPFVRDSQNRITQITDPLGNVYSYSYDASGNLASVTYPNTAQPSTYTYDANHLYLSGTDFRNNPLPSTGYYGSADTDPNGLPLNGRLHTVTDGLGETTTYDYDLVAHSTTITYPPDGSGNVGKATLVYDSNGKLLSSTDPLGHTTTNTYDVNLNLTSVTDALGNKTTYSYDAKGNRTSQAYPATATSTNTTSTTTYNLYSEPSSTRDELGNVRTFNYDASFNPQSVTDSLGTLMSTSFNSNGTMQAGAIGFDITQQPARASIFTYDADGNLSSKTDALGRTTSYTYDTLGHKITMTEPVPSGSSATAATTTYQYDAFGNLTQTSAPLGRMTSSTYDGNGNKLSDTDARGNTIKYQYDALNRLILTTYPDGSTASKSYDFRGNVVKATDQGGHTTCYQYDLAGRETSVTQACGTSSATSVSYTYDADGRKLTETDALGHTTSYTYDNAGNLLSVSGPQGNFQYGYDDARNRISMTDGNGNTTKYVYDARKRLIETDYPDGTKKTNAYDGPGNLASVTDQVGNVVQYTYDAANQLQSVIQASSPNTSANTTVFGYDADGNAITLEDANLHTTTSSFDLLGEPTAKTLPDGSLTETRQYDANGNLVSLTHFNGVTTTYTYDNLNRLLSRTTPGEAPVSFTYTPTGKYATSTDASGTTIYSYDSMDRLTSKQTPEGTLNYTYDAAGHVASIASSNANGASMAYTYDSLNRLSTVTDNRTGGVTNYSYDAASNVATVTYPNGVQTLFHYDTLNRVMGATTQQTGYIYQRGPTGNLTSVMDANGRTVNWTYDGIYRLTGETVSLDPAKHNGSVGYGLDPVGNRLSETSTLTGISSGSFGYNADDELASETYDQNGNVLTSGGKSFSYDAENHLVAMNGGAVQMVYDAFENRVAKTANGVTTRYLVEDDVNPTGYPQVFDELTNGVVARTYAYGLQRISETQAVNNVLTTSYYGYDGMGTVRQLTNAAGAITDTYDYGAFGNLVNSTGTTPNNYLYRGEQWDADLGLYYLRARYYNPVTDRFMSRDLVDGNGVEPNSLHRYVYANDDPVDLADPAGTTALSPVAPERASAGGAVGEYAVLVLQAASATVALADAGCAVGTAYYVLARRFVNDANISTGDCKAKGEGRMRIQLQFGTTVTAPVTQVLVNEDPPGVTISQVGGGLTAIWGAAQSGIGGFPKSLTWDLKNALVSVSVCAKKFVPSGTLGWPKTICSAQVGTSGWRVDLDQLNGNNLTQ